MTAAVEPGVTPKGDMVWIAGGEFTMGSDRHYPEERPARRVLVDGFWIDRYQVTNDDFAAFVADTGHVTVAERVPDAADYPGAIPDLLVAASMVFVNPGRKVDLRNHYNWWAWVPGSRLASPPRSGQRDRGQGRPSRGPCRLGRRDCLRRLGGQGAANRSGVGVRQPGRARRRRVRLG